MMPAQRNATPYGYLDLGMAHGLAGLLAALAILYREREPPVPGITGALRRGCERLGATVLRPAVAAPAVLTGPVWPRYVPLAPNGVPVGSGPVHRPSWCYGTAGMARALVLAADVLGDAGYRALAFEASAELGTSKSPTVCHGSAGLALASAHRLWEFGGDTGHLAAPLLAAYDATVPLGYRDVEASGGPVDNPGVLTGAAGVAMVLSALDASSPPAWSRLLLLG